MIRSMYSGIAGLKNFQTKLDVIGNNIANVNTFGFKKGRVTFQEAMNQTIQGASAAVEGRGGKNPLQVGLGSVTATIDSVQTQASLQNTGRSLDLAINGDGFFVVQGPGGQNLYTRGGNFYLDQTGMVVTGDGYRVQQFTGTGELDDIFVNSSAVLAAQTTTQVTLQGNLPSNLADPNFEFSTQMKVTDTVGTEHVIRVDITPQTVAGPPVSVSPNQWNVNFTNGGNTTTMPLTFDAAGVPTFTPGATIPIGGGTLALPAAAYNFANLTNDPNDVTFQVNANGNQQGVLESFSVSASGVVNGVYSNGLVEEIATLSLAIFNNPSGLVKVGNNLFQESVNSGVANLGTSEDAGGTISSGTLEMSNVDLSEEFTEMITAQRGFQANTRIITTSDQILEELVNLKR
ncbi:flagellar hook protein FlgE [Jeotgalibacillus sp. R-1-5s-1]|uniref:flagellar hook protein FlgE n=1 Tax=Jeotgalibacillus sp. R-1-5s-1 TaxID=2555897 RepID=UPI00106D4807|nr:flagellar hook-basal body complex protein [Jeotgalibacillus sp. R-1-5s-1]TFE03492.1 flagellar hook-basal body complex protein [Jeotgalibacillus sp. R-1-5s-1]